MTTELFGPLAGIKVLEFGTLVAGPFCSRILGEFGAEVIKVESPDGDPLRKWRVMKDDTSLWWSVHARNKKSITLNLDDPEARIIAKKLALQADIIVENFRPGVLEKWNLGYEQLKLEKPSLIMVRISGFGQTGPMKDLPGFGSVGESMGGLRHVTGFDDRPPVRSGISLGDSLAGLHGALGAMMALRHRDTTGHGQMVDVALYEAVFNMMESVVPEYDYAKVIRERTGNSIPGVVPSNTYATADGGNIVIGGNGDAIFKRLMIAIDRADLANDPGLVSNPGRAIRMNEIDGAISDWCLRHPINHVIETMKSAQVPASKVYSVEDMLHDPQYIARGMFETHRFSDGSPIQVPAVIPKLSETPGQTQWLGPKLGEHTDEVLSELGFSQNQISEFKMNGIV